MHILFLTDNFPPEVNAPATRTFEHCREWVKAGKHVTVITCAPNFPHGKLLGGYRNAWRTHELVEGIKLVRVWSYITANDGFFKRVLDHFSFALSAFIAGLSQRSDVIVATSPQFFTTFAAFALSKVKRRPWVFEVRDLWPATIAALGTIKQKRLLGFLEKIELALYRDAAMVVVVTEAFKRDLVKRGIEAAKIRVVTNGVNRASFAPQPKDPELVQRHDLIGKTIVGYVGTHGNCQGLEFIVDCAAAVTDPTIHFLFVGAGADRQMVIDRSAALGLTNTTFVESVSKTEVARYIATADIMLVPLRKAEVFTTVIPSKIFEAAGMGRPILIGVDGEARAIIERFGSGCFYEPEDQSSFFAALAKMRGGGPDHEAMIAGCRSMAAHYDRDRLAAEMAVYLTEVAAT